MLSTRSRILEEREQQREELRGALTAFKQSIAAYSDILSQADQLAQQQYANAVELKKRIGRQQLQGDAIPDGITEALNRDRIDQLEADIATTASQHADVDQQIEMLSEPNENAEKLRTSLDETLVAVGKRLDLLKDEEVLKEKYKLSPKDLSEGDRTAFEQAARRRAETAQSREEALLSIVPSAAAEGITASLEFLYKEMIELETKQANLQEQKRVTERIIELGEAEKASIDELLPILRNEVTHLANVEAAAWVRIQAQLMPQQADELLDTYEAKTGEHLPPPPPIPEDQRVAAITQATENLLERHAEVVAVTKWVSLFEKRLSISGLDGEIGKYQDQVGAIDAQSAANQRRIHRLSGYPLQTLADLAPEEQPKTAADRQRLLQGSIGALRKDRSNLRQQTVIAILIKFAVIIVVALILAWIVGLIFNRISNRARRSGVTGSAQTQLVMSFFKTILRSAIWITAIVLGLNTVGFDVGAVLAGLGIGGLAVAMAARETLADVIGGVMLFVARPFVLGDSIQVASGPVAKVTHMTWRTTTLLTTTDYLINVPNSQVANSNIQNFSRNYPIQDYCTVYVSTEQPSAYIESLIEEALSACTLIQQDQAYGGMLSGIAPMGDMTVTTYWAWYYLSDYHSRYGVRSEVWHHIMKRFAEAGVDLELKAFDEKPPEEMPMKVNASASDAPR